MKLGLSQPEGRTPVPTAEHARLSCLANVGVSVAGQDGRDTKEDPVIVVPTRKFSNYGYNRCNFLYVEYVVCC